MSKHKNWRKIAAGGYHKKTRGDGKVRRWGCGGLVVRCDECLAVICTHMMRAHDAKHGRKPEEVKRG